MRRKMYPNRMKYDYLLPFFFPVGSCSNILHSFKLKARPLMLCPPPHCHPDQSKVTRCPAPRESTKDKAELESVKGTLGGRSRSACDKGTGKAEGLAFE